MDTFTPTRDDAMQAIVERQKAERASLLSPTRNNVNIPAGGMSPEMRAFQAARAGEEAAARTGNTFNAVSEAASRAPSTNVNFAEGGSPEMRAVRAVQASDDAALRAGNAVANAREVARANPVPRAPGALGVIAKASTPLMLGLTANEVAQTPTEAYQRRFGIQPGRFEMSPGAELVRDIGTRALGAASDFVNVGGVLNSFYADKRAPAPPPEAPVNAKIDTRLLAPRDAAHFEARQQMNAMSALALPVQSAPGIVRVGNSYFGEGAAPATPAMTTEQANEYYGAQLRGMKAAEQQREQQGVIANNNLMRAEAARATAWQNDQTAQREAHIADWRATNSADVVLGARGRNGISGERIAAQRSADAAGSKAMGARAALAAADAAVAGAGNGAYTSPLDDFAKQQQAVQGGQAAALNRPAVFAAQERAGVDLAGAKMDLDSRKQVAELDKAIAAETDPKTLAMLHNKRLAIAGKAPDNKVAVIDVDTGQKDMMGNPIFKKSAVNLATGEVLNGSGENADKASAAIRRLKAMPKEQAIREAKAAVAQGAKVADVNAWLKAAGHPPI